MKSKALLILIVQAVFICFGQARTMTVDGITFGDAEGDLITVGLSTPPERIPELKRQINPILDACIREKRHPFSWQSYAPEGVGFILLVTGPLDEIYKSIEKHSNGVAPIWIWSGIGKESDVSLKIRMDSRGDGTLQIILQNYVVGCMPVKSSPRAKQLKPGNFKVSSRGTQKMQGEIGQKSIKWDSWMPWAFGIENPVDGCYVHGGSLVEDSDGCVHVFNPASKILYHLVRKGTPVEIIQD